MAEVDPNVNNPDDTPPVTSASRSKPNLTDLERNNILLDLVKEGGENWQLQRGAIARIAKARGTSWQTVMRLWHRALETSGPAHTGTVDVSSKKNQSGRRALYDHSNGQQQENSPCQGQMPDR